MNKPSLLAFGLLWVSVAALLSSQLHGYWLGLCHGALAVAFVSTVLVLFLVNTSSTWQVAGAWGEDNTRSELRTATRLRLIWGCIDSIELADGDIDHLVVTRRGLLALDSKWHSKTMNREDIATDATRATRAARKAQSVMISIKRPMPIQPVVVVWGPAHSAVPKDGVRIHGVNFVAGPKLLAWLRPYSLGDIESPLARSILHDLGSFLRRVDPAAHRPSSNYGSPRRQGS
jgi:hypothetical protein